MHACSSDFRRTAHAFLSIYLLKIFPADTLSRFPFLWTFRMLHTETGRQQALQELLKRSYSDHRDSIDCCSFFRILSRNQTQSAAKLFGQHNTLQYSAHRPDLSV